MKLPELMLGVSFAPKFHLRLILPATRNEEKTKFLVAGSHAPPAELTLGVLASSTKETPPPKFWAGVLSTVFLILTSRNYTYLLPTDSLPVLRFHQTVYNIGSYLLLYIAGSFFQV